jgi:hypothetical protein
VCTWEPGGLKTVLLRENRAWPFLLLFLVNNPAIRLARPTRLTQVEMADHGLFRATNGQTRQAPGYLPMIAAVFLPFEFLQLFDFADITAQGMAVLSTAVFFCCD